MYRRGLCTTRHAYHEGSELIRGLGGGEGWRGLLKYMLCHCYFSTSRNLPLPGHLTRQFHVHVQLQLILLYLLSMQPSATCAGSLLIAVLAWATPLYASSIEWGDCPSFLAEPNSIARCANYSVPMDWDYPDKGNITIGMAKFPARKPEVCLLLGVRAIR